ncbi:MAG: dipeptide epimerase [Nocardioides sp.]|nr:dipeptide epimerase [Nocardioides sp.]
MTIVDVRCHHLTTALHSPFVTALRRTTDLETTVVEIIDDTGERGFGEAPQVWRVTGESLEGSRACLEGPLADVVRGRSSDDLVDLTRAVAEAVVGNFGAKAAMDVALHDLAARRTGLSLPRFLGTARHQVETDVTVSVGELSQLSTDALRRVEDGFTVLKLKVGTDARTDTERIVAVREAVGDRARIRVDANQGWTAREAITTICAIEDAGGGLEFVEQPVPAADLAALGRVTAAVDTPIMADETVFGLRDLVEVVRRNAADLVNVKLAKCGGLSTARTLLEFSRTHGVGTIVGSMMEGPIGVGAAASLVAALGTTYTSDLDAAWWAAVSPVEGGIEYHGGTIVLPDLPGLGIGSVK